MSPQHTEFSNEVIEMYMAKMVSIAMAMAGVLAYGASLEKNVLDIEQARADIEAAINAKGGTARGGLKNAAEDIVNIPDKIEFEKTYVAWSNATITVEEAWTNVHTGFMLLPYLEANGSQRVELSGVRANQNTSTELAISDQNLSTHILFGDRTTSSAKYGFHIYNNGFSYMYAGNWNDNVVGAKASAVLRMDGNQFYLDGELKATKATATFLGGSSLTVFNQTGCSEPGMQGKLLYVAMTNAVTSANEVLPDILLLPALDPSGTPCLVDVLSNPLNPSRYYNSGTGSFQYSTQTNEWVANHKLHDQYSFQSVVCYETNMVGAADNKLIMDDATQFVYDRMVEESSGGNE